VGIALVAVAIPSCSGGRAAAPGPARAFSACMVTDTAGIDDHSSNASAYQGLLNAALVDPGIAPEYLVSPQVADYVPNIKAMVGRRCGIIVTVGSTMGDATQEGSASSRQQHFAIVDYTYSPPLPNVQAVTFDTAQAAFLGGYLAAGMSKAAVVATFGGQRLPAVTVSMDGFWEGVQYYNAKHGTDVRVLGWDEKSQEGSFTGDFINESKGQSVTETLIQRGADVIFPVAGGAGLGAAAEAQRVGKGVHLLWEDTDGCVSAPQYCSLFVSSVEKDIPTAVQRVVTAAAHGSFRGGGYVGTLANGGVGLAPYHDFAAQVPQMLTAELDQVKQGIISGSITISSPAEPVADT